MIGSASFGISMAVITRVGTPIDSSAFIIASALMIVASIPIESPVTRFTPFPAPVSPRKMLPPPRTMPTSTPIAWIFLMRSAMKARFFGSMHSPVDLLPSTSPDNFSRIRRYLTLQEDFFTPSIISKIHSRGNRSAADFAHVHWPMARRVARRSGSPARRMRSWAVSMSYSRRR